MDEGEARRVEELPLEAEITGDPVDRIAGYRQVDGGQMNPDLVRPAGLEPDAQQCMARQQLLELEMRYRRARGGRVERMPKPVMPVATDRGVDRPAPRPRPPRHERKVLARQLPAPHEPLQPLVGLVRARDDEQPRRVAVEPVDDARTVL